MAGAKDGAKAPVEEQPELDMEVKVPEGETAEDTVATETEAEEKTAEGKETPAEEAETTEVEEETKHEEHVPYDKFRDKNEEAKEYKRRAEEAERKLEERERVSPEVRKQKFEAEYAEDPYGANRRLSQETTFSMLDYIEARNDIIEDLAKDNPAFKSHVSAVKKALKRSFPDTADELRGLAEREFYASIGRNTTKELSSAREKGRNDVIRNKRVVGPGVGVGSTPNRSGSKVQLTDEAVRFARGMNLSDKELEDDAKKGRVME